MDRSVLEPQVMSLGATHEDRFVARFNYWLREPDAYRQMVAKKCAGFPEGDLLPFTLPITGYVNLAVAHPERAVEARQRVEALLDLAIPAVARHVGVRTSALSDISSYQGQGVYLGQLAMALGSARLIGAADRWAQLHSRVCDVLCDGLHQRQGLPLMSFPGQNWPFDTIPCIFALWLKHRLSGTAHYAEAVRQHLAWVEERGCDPESGLPWSRVDADTGAGTDPPRGCELPWRITLLAQMNRPRAVAMYRRFVKTFWIERGVLAGFAEWPHGANLGEDADSGPIVWGIGLAATGFGVGAATAAGDSLRLFRLKSELAMHGILLPVLRPMLQRELPICQECITGLLMGDAAMFAMTSWCDWALGAR